MAEPADGDFAEARAMTIEIKGMAHVILTVSWFDLARAFYGKLLPEFGMKAVYDGDKFFYCFGARTAIGIEPCDPALAGERFVQQRVFPSGALIEGSWVRNGLAAGGRWTRTIGPCRERAGLYCGR
jgi:hypothetical protein